MLVHEIANDADQNGDAGTAAAMEAAFSQIATGKGQAVNDMLDNAPPGPIETKWGTIWPYLGASVEFPVSLSPAPSSSLVGACAIELEAGGLERFCP